MEASTLTQVQDHKYKLADSQNNVIGVYDTLEQAQDAGSLAAAAKYGVEYPQWIDNVLVVTIPAYTIYT